MSFDALDIIGKRFNRLIVLKYVKYQNARYYYLCKCDCGKESIVERGHLLSGHTKSCGCYNKEKLINANSLSEQEIYDIINNKYGNLTPTKYNGKINGRHTYLCKCDCGNESIVERYNLISGNSKSCGICCRETHGFAFKNRPLYSRYIDMIHRCLDVNDKSYYRYGARGIKICDRWIGNIDIGRSIYFGDDGIYNFFIDMEESFNIHVNKYGIFDTTLDRIDIDGNYEPSNCRWATRIEQANNTSTNLYVQFNGEKYSFANLLRYIGDPRISYDLAYRRYTEQHRSLINALTDLDGITEVIEPIHFKK